MFILGIQGSPRIRGNSKWLLESFLRECEKHGAKTQTIDTCKADILPCKELIVCEKKGYCPLKDDMEKTIYALIKKADIVVLASPVFFYNVTAQAKTLIDRCQMFWGRKYKLKLLDPHSFSRKGFLLSVGASGGKKLFDGVHLTGKYFFDAISADYTGSLTYSNIERAKSIQSHPGVKDDIKKAVKDLLKPFLERKTIVFISKYDACRGQIAGALARIHSKGKLNIITAGYDAKTQILPELFAVMEEKKLDLMYKTPQSIEKIKPVRIPDMVINLDSNKLDSNKKAKKIAAIDYLDWDIKEPCDKTPESLRQLTDKMELKIKNLVTNLNEFNSGLR
jgi:arsenate reductase